MSWAGFFIAKNEKPPDKGGFMYPTREEVKKLAASGKYKRIPVCREIYADEFTPVQVMRILRGASRHCYLLESASQDEN